MWIFFACMSNQVSIVATTPTSGTIPLEISLQADGLNKNQSVDVYWDLDGQTFTETDLDYTWLASGVHTVQLTAEYPNGNSSSDSIEVVVQPEVCPEIEDTVSDGLLLDATINEVSGVVESRANPGVLWVHNDSGDTPSLYAINSTGDLLGTYTLKDGPAGDWEDLAIGINPATEAHVLYVGDIGDNSTVRDSIRVFLIEEPQVDANQPHIEEDIDWGAITLEYPDGPLNAETLLLDPVTNDLYIVTKDYGGATGIYRKASPHQNGQLQTLELVTSLDFSESPLSGSATTGGAISPLGNHIAIRTYTPTGFLWLRDQAMPFSAAFTQAPCVLTLPIDQQGESIGFAEDGSGLWTISEGANPPINYTPLSAP